MIKPLNTHYSFENPASVYDEEALTALELAGRQGAKINEVIGDQNRLRQETEQHLENQDNTIQERMASQDAKIKTMNEVAMPANVTAEVQEQIDNGTFDRAINEYAGELEQRLNNLLSNVPIGGTTSDAELIDMRSGCDGINYASAGESVRGQFAKALRSGFWITDHSVYSSADNLPANTICGYSFYGENATLTLGNAPGSGNNGIIMTFNNVNGIYMQMCLTEDSQLYFRRKWGSGANYGTWKRVVDDTNISSLITPLFNYGGQYNTDEVLNNLNDLEPNRMHVISLYTDDTDVIANMPNNERHGIVLTFGHSENGGRIQLFVSNGNNIYIRSSWGVVPNMTWSGWATMVRNTDIGVGDASVPLGKVLDNPGLLGCFLNVGCIGDSLASGECVATDGNGNPQYIDIYNHSWGKYLERMTGNTYHIWASGGRTTASWLTSSHATECFDGNHLCEAYIIGLGQNDKNQNVSVGSPADINLANYNNNNASSYYGNYGKIIQKIKEVQPKAKIFVLTDPSSATENGGYNGAIREIATMFDNVYLVDLYTYGQHLFQSDYIKANARYGHYNAVAYREFALYIASYIEWIMRNNPDEFLEIEYIGTNYSYS